MALQQLQAGYEQYQPVKQSLSKAALHHSRGSARACLGWFIHQLTPAL